MNIGDEAGYGHQAFDRDVKNTVFDLMADARFFGIHVLVGRDSEIQLILPALILLKNLVPN